MNEELYCILLLYFISAIDGCDDLWPNLCKIQCDWEIEDMFVENCTSKNLFKGLWNDSLHDFDIKFINSRLTTVPGHAFAGFKLKALEFKNTFNRFDEDAFQDLEVRYIDIIGNPQLKHIPAGLFRGLSMLKELNIMHNEKITCLPGTLFVGLQSLVAVVVSKNNIKSFRSNIFQPLSRVIPPHGRKVYISIGQLHGKAVELCAQTFKGVRAKVYGDPGKDYQHKVHKCIIECSNVTGLIATASTEICDCESTKRCSEERCTDSAAPREARTGILVSCLSGIFVTLKMMG